jgi:transcriptional regulator with XRE-family HTH domain
MTLTAIPVRLAPSARSERINVQLGKRLRRRRQLLGLTQTEVAQRHYAIFGDGKKISFQQVHKCEAGLMKISAERLWEFAQVLKVPVSYFYDGLSVRRASLAA